MNDQLKGALEAIMNEVVAKEREVILPLKQAANQLCKIMGADMAYNLLDSGGEENKSKLTWKVDHFFNKPLSPSVVLILSRKRESGSDGPCSVDEIHQHLISGGYRFEGGGKPENEKRALKIALTKNTAQFSKISEDVFGLRTWYYQRSQRNGKKQEEGSDEIEATPEVAAESKPPETEESATETTL